MWAEGVGWRGGGGHEGSGSQAMDYGITMNVSDCDVIMQYV